MAYIQPILVRRGEILLGFDINNNWDTELQEMNKDKVGLFHRIRNKLTLVHRCD